ncbi:MAG: CDP-diacylglycerol--serine O-phosphatidyltransferase [Polyangiales bacterium]
MRKLSLRKTLFILPNLLTLLSVLCGYNAVLLCAGQPTDDDFYRAALLIVFAMFFDTIDGRVARLTKTQSALGVQLDSLADVLSFGMAPAVLVHRWSLHALGTAGLLIAFGYLACGTIRLARFNVISTTTSGAPKKPGKYILGLPIPAAAGILISIVVAHTLTGHLSSAPPFIALVVVALSFFMVSTIRFRSFKDLKLSWRTGVLVALAIGSTVFVAVRFHPSMALVWLVASYVTIGLVEAILRIARRLSGHEEPKESEAD